QEAIAGVLHNPAPVLADLRIDQFTEMPLEPLVRAFLIGAHQARIARHIGGQDCGKASSCGHSSGKPALRRPSTWRARVSGRKNGTDALTRAIVKPGSSSSTRPSQSRASSMRPSCADATTLTNKPGR